MRREQTPGGGSEFPFLEEFKYPVVFRKKDIGLFCKKDTGVLEGVNLGDGTK